MPTIDELDSPDAGKWLSPEDKAKLIRELKERLKEIERLKRELGEGVRGPPVRPTVPSTVPSSSLDEHSESGDESPHPVSTGRVAEEVEELRVPSLEMLDDKPLKKKKQENSI